MARKPHQKASKTSHRKRRALDDASINTSDGFPSKADLIAFVQNATQKIGKRDIARAFGIKGHDRKRLKLILRELAEDGILIGNRREFRKAGSLPAVTILMIVSRDSDGDLIGEPLKWDSDEGPKPRLRIIISEQPGSRLPALGIDDRILARVTKLEPPEPDGISYTATPMRRLPREGRRLLGILQRDERGAFILPVDRKALREWRLANGTEIEAEAGDLVRFELQRSGRLADPQARITEILGNPNDQRQISLIAIHTHAIPDDHPEPVTASADALEPFDASRPGAMRQDLRHLPLVTIDPEDARDHDDAVHATTDTDPANPDGHIITVAIADVAHYVRPNTALDREARLRGNSVYFPDRVVPMLPERISNDLCSLREGQDRPCLAIEMVFDKHGSKRRHKVLRGIMRSTAKLSYQQAQAAFDGKPDNKTERLCDDVLKPLWQAYQALAGARDTRGPLDLDLPERKIKLNGNGNVSAIIIPERLEAHRLIEEFMIQANVAAAQCLEDKRAPLIYRVHEGPSKEKLKALRDFLDSLDIPLPPANTLKAAHFNKILAQSHNLPVKELVHEVVLRSQSQAVYASQNAGHFGLNLARYTHFTSPIRRYADLIVHRALIMAFGLGDDGLDPAATADLADIADQTSTFERRAMAAERETIDRLIAAYLADRIGSEFDARISGMSKTGLFVRLTQTGADGYVPAASLADDYYAYDEDAYALVGERTGRTYHLGDSVRVRLLDVIASAGALRFEMLTPPRKASSRLSHKLLKKKKTKRRRRTKR